VFGVNEGIVSGRVGVVCWKAKFRSFRMDGVPSVLESSSGQHAEVRHPLGGIARSRGMALSVKPD
jgi:hypothetical protein